MKLSDKLIELRKEKSWSQEDFAEKLDVSRQAISRWENGTALPDAQNILRISKLFNVTADYLLNDDSECRTDNLEVKAAVEENTSPIRKKKCLYWYLIPAICFTLLAVCVIMIVGKSSSDPTSHANPHPVLRSVKENEVAPTCMSEGSYDEVVYCTECGVEVLRTQRSTEKIAHRFQDGKCIVCNEYQPSEGLLYMSDGNGTCFVDLGDCTDENIVIPAYSSSGEKVTQIKAYAFAGSHNIKSIRIPETVTVIGEGAFQSCASLESVNLPKSITTIYSYTFDGCKKLKEVTIPAGVSSIGQEAFADCIACESIVIPASVTKIGKFAFRNFSGCDGSVAFEKYNGWGLYDDSGNFVDPVAFQNGKATPVKLLTFLYCEYTWKRVDTP